MYSAGAANTRYMAPGPSRLPSTDSEFKSRVKQLGRWLQPYSSTFAYHNDDIPAHKDPWHDVTQAGLWSIATYVNRVAELKCFNKSNPN